MCVGAAFASQALCTSSITGSPQGALSGTTVCNARQLPLAHQEKSFWADGNHEGLSAGYYDQFALPGNEDRTHHEHWHAAPWGPLRIIALNDVTVPSEAITGTQREFLDATLRAVDRQHIPWVLTMHHQPMHSDAEGHEPDLLTRRAWGPLLDRYRVDVDLSGHVHNYESSLPLRSDETVVPEGLGAQHARFVLPRRFLCALCVTSYGASAT